MVDDIVTEHEENCLAVEQDRDEAIVARDETITACNIAVEELNGAVGMPREEFEEEFEDYRKRLDAEIEAAAAARQQVAEYQKIVREKTKLVHDAVNKQVAAEKSRRRVIISATTITTFAVAIAVALSVYIRITADTNLDDAQVMMKNAKEMVQNPDGMKPVPVVESRNDSHLGITIATNNGEGVLINDVTNNSAAHQAGLESGDVIHRLDDIPLTSLQDYFDGISLSSERIRLHVLKSDGTTARIITIVLPTAQE